ncbi:MAG: restriction endonuclease [Bacteroidota bacterium]
MAKKNGKLLESMVAELERLLSTVPNTVIKKRHKLKDRDGKNREIDVYVEVLVNRKTLKYAFECKEYGPNSYVKMADIDVFFNKISNHGIMGFFVTTGKYQKNAVEKAENLGIETLVFEKEKDPLIKGLKVFKKDFELINLSYSSPLFDFNPDYDLSEVFLGRDKLLSIDDFSQNYMKEWLVRLLEGKLDKLGHDFWKLDGNKISLVLKERRSETVYGELENVFIKDKDQFYPLDKYKAVVDVWFDFMEKDVLESFIYKSISSSKNLASFFSERIKINEEDIGHFYVVESGGESDLKISLSNDGPPIDLVQLGVLKDVKITTTRHSAK